MKKFKINDIKPISVYGWINKDKNGNIPNHDLEGGIEIDWVGREGFGSITFYQDDDLIVIQAQPLSNESVLNLMTSLLNSSVRLWQDCDVFIGSKDSLNALKKNNISPSSYGGYEWRLRTLGGVYNKNLITVGGIEFSNDVVKIATQLAKTKEGQKSDCIIVAECLSIIDGEYEDVEHSIAVDKDGVFSYLDIDMNIVRKKEQ